MSEPIELLFKCVECSAYLKKVNDGVHISLTYGEPNEDKSGTFHHADGSETKCQFEGDGVDKTYYTRKDAKFRGLVVGIKGIVAKGLLFTDTGYHYNGEDYGYVGKQAVETVRCAIVYYSDNKKRYVPLDAIKEATK